MDLLALSLLSNLIVALFIFLCTALILIILLQKGRGGGIGAAFGGGGAAGSLLGTKTGDFLTWVTITLVAAFLILAVLMGKFMRPSGSLPDLASPVAPPVTAETDTATTDGTSVVLPSETATDAAPTEGEATVDVVTEEVSEESTDVPAAEEDAVEPVDEAVEPEADSGPIPAEELAEEIIN